MAGFCFQAAFKKVKDAFRSGKTRDVEFRRDQLRKLLKLVEDNEDAIAQAVAKDMHKVWFSALYIHMALYEKRV